MTKQTFQFIALLTLPLAAALTYVIGRPFAPWLSSLSDDLSGILTLLAYVLAALVATVCWAVALLPLRRRAGFTPLSDEFAQVRAEGVVSTFRREQDELESRGRSTDPAIRAGYYKGMALTGLGVTVVGAALSVALLSDGYLMAFPVACAIVGFPLTVYYTIQFFRWSARRRQV